MSGRPKSLSSAFSRKELDDEEFIAGVHEMHMGADRGAALIGAALVENALVESIMAYLHHPEPKGSLFYDQGAPFGTFANRVTAARAMDLITTREHADLNQIRDLRNQFAHTLQPVNFEAERIAKICEGLADYDYPDMPEGREVSGARLKYEMACCGLWVLIMQRGTRLRELTIKRLEDQLMAANALALDNIEPGNPESGK